MMKHNSSLLNLQNLIENSYGAHTLPLILRITNNVGTDIFLHCSDLHLLWLDVCICRCIGNGLRVRDLVKVSRAGFGSRLGLTQSEKVSREAPGPSVHGRMRFVSSLRMSILGRSCLIFQVGTVRVELLRKGKLFFTASCSDAALHTIFTGTDMRPRLLFLPG